MMRNAFLVIAIALPVMAAAQQDPNHTGSIPQTTHLTEHDVRQRLETAGYTAIGSLERDSEGFWRTTAMKGEDMRSVSVSRDGNIEDR